MTDVEMDKLPELQIRPEPNEQAYAGMCGWRIYTLYWADGELKITNSASGGYSDYAILYTNGLLRISHGQSMDQVDWFDTLQGEHLACFVCLGGYGDSGSAPEDSIMEGERNRWKEAGYEQVYVTYDGASDESGRMVSDFAAEHGGKEVPFYSLEEILNMLSAPDTIYI